VGRLGVHRVGSETVDDYLRILIPTAVVAGAVIAAIVTGIFSLTTLLISKEDKVTDARQKWLDGLRDETAKFLAGIDTLVRLVEVIISKKSGEKRLAGLTVSDLASFREENAEQYENLNEMKNRVLLRLDPQDHPNLIKQINYLTIAFYDASCNNLEEVRARQSEVIEGTQQAIKRAWEKVKQGEKTFRHVRTFLQIVVMAPLIVLAILAGAAAAFWIKKYLPATTAP